MVMIRRRLLANAVKRDLCIDLAENSSLVLISKMIQRVLIL